MEECDHDEMIEFTKKLKTIVQTIESQMKFSHEYEKVGYQSRNGSGSWTLSGRYL